jgi:SMI1 / KNR4 family (SUKH-1)
MQLEEQLHRLGIRPIRDRYLPLSESDLSSLEQHLGCRLPSPYRDFITRYGQSVFDHEIRVCVEGCSRRPVIDLFFGSRRDPQYKWDPTSLSANIEIFRGRMPNALIPIGESGNDLLCLGICGSDRGKVFLWERDGEISEGEGEAAKYRNVCLLADSFGEFIDRLEVSDVD